MIKRASNQLKMALMNNNHVTLAVSGGVDSMVLLDLARRTGLQNFTVGHFVHCDEHMDLSAKTLVENYCQLHHIRLMVGYGHITNKRSFEAAARRLRYEFLSSIGNALIITGHHLDDQIETIFMGITRGLPIDKCNMARYTCHDTFCVYRPFLDTHKQAFYKLAHDTQLAYEEDATNYTLDNERKIWRNVVIPLLMKYRNVRKTIVKSVPTPTLRHVLT